MIKKGLIPKKKGSYTENGGKYINVTLFKGIAAHVCHVLPEMRVKLQEARESWSPVTHLEIILACVSDSSLSHVRSQV